LLLGAPSSVGGRGDGFFSFPRRGGAQTSVALHVRLRGGAKKMRCIFVGATVTIETREMTILGKMYSACSTS